MKKPAPGRRPGAGFSQNEWAHSGRPLLAESASTPQVRPSRPKSTRAPCGPAEIPDVRALWWRLCARGVRLPAERGLIVIPGDRT
jgi:hypothetical protein